jgi:hypothetical protein
MAYQALMLMARLLEHKKGIKALHSIDLKGEVSPCVLNTVEAVGSGKDVGIVFDLGKPGAIDVFAHFMNFDAKLIKAAREQIDGGKDGPSMN